MQRDDSIGSGGSTQTQHDTPTVVLVGVVGSDVSSVVTVGVVGTVTTDVGGTVTRLVVVIGSVVLAGHGGIRCDVAA